MAELQVCFSAPGRTELGGNHTDHQNGRVLAAAIDREAAARVTVTGGPVLRVCSQGYAPAVIALDDLDPRPEERGTTAALVRGVAAAFARLGCPLRGMEAQVTSTVLPGGGRSSAAAFEVLMGTIFNELFFDRRLSPADLARVGQQAENDYFGKPCGLMDQMASAMGGLVYLDFADPQDPLVRRLEFDFSACGHALCMLDCGTDHAGLTDEYAAIPGEMAAVSAWFGRPVLRQVPEEDFLAQLPQLRRAAGDRAVLRALHFYEEDRRVERQAAALAGGDFPRFLQLVRQSGQSSWMYLQNVIPGGDPAHQDMAVALALCHCLLGDRGAFRVHGGGFAGAVQAFVPLDLLPGFREEMERLLGKGSVQVLSIRGTGGVRLS